MVELLIVVIVVALMLQRRYMRRAKDTRNLKYSCRPSVRACEPGEVFLVHSDIANPGQRNSAAIHIEEQFPRQLQVLESESFDITVLNDGLCLFNSSAIIPKKQQIKRSFRASLSERGEYRFAHAFFHAGDFLGIREYSYRMENDARIVIYPPRLENEAFLKSFSDAADEIAQKKQLLEDPISVCGYDPYTGREPLRKISWKQSAARGELIVKKNDPVRNQSVQILLDMQYHGEFECHFSRQEICFSIARAVCEELENRHIAYRYDCVKQSDSRFYHATGRGRTSSPRPSLGKHRHRPKTIPAKTAVGSYDIHDLRDNRLCLQPLAVYRPGPLISI